MKLVMKETMEVSLSFFSEDGWIQYLTGIVADTLVITSAALTYPTLEKEKIFATFKFGQTFRRSSPTEIIPLHSDELHSNLLAVFKDFHYTNLKIEMLSTFLILKFDEKISQQLKYYSTKNIYSENPFLQGDEIFIKFIPEGEKMFFPTLSNGIVSVALEEPCKITLTTANLCSSSSGAPIYRNYNNQRALSGMVIGNMSDILGIQEKGSHVLTKLYLCVHVSTFIEGIYNPQTFTILESPQNAVTFGHEYLVSIESGPRMGSGILLSRNGLIMTCSHVVNFESDVEVTIFFSENKTCSGHVIFASDSESILDIAFIDSNVDFEAIPCSISSVPPLEGEDLYIAGFLLLECCTMKFLNKGLLSSYKPYIISTCLTFPGCSGGAIINKDGLVIGMATCIYDIPPNFGATRGLPLYFLQPYLNDYIETKNSGIIKTMFNAYLKTISSKL